MINLQITAFHLDFSTLDMERGKADIIPSGNTLTIQPTIIPPMIKVEGMLIDENKDSKEAMFVKTDFEEALRKVSRKSKKVKGTK